MQTLKEEIREKIISAAREEFFAIGFKQASTRKIIQRSKISNGNLYNYFQSKNELFEAVVLPFHEQFERLAANLFEDEGIEDFSPQKIDLISANIGGMLEDYRKEFIIIMNKSQGTAYENYKVAVIRNMAGHFQKNVKAQYQTTGLGEGFIMQVVATNIVEGLLKLSANYKNKSWAMENIKLLFLYHTHGIAQFYP